MADLPEGFREKSIGGIDKFKQGFFDRASVRHAMRGTAFRAIQGTALFTRKTSINSMKKGKTKGKKRVPSKPGKPPLYWGEGLIRKHTYSAYDEATDSVVVGAAQLGRSRVPNQLEFGDGGKRISERPAIRPAFEKAKTRLAQRLAAGGKKSFAKGRR